MSTFFIGIDNGSQSTKVAILDERGVVVSTGRCVLRPNDTPSPGVVEHPDDDLWESIGHASREAMAAFAGDPSDIVGIGLCTIRFCRALLTADGSLAQPVLSWMDERVSRAYEHVDDRVRYVTTSSGYISHRLTGQFTDTAANYQGQWPIDTDRWQWSTDDAVIDSYGIGRDMLFTLVMPGDTLGSVTAEAARFTGLPEGLPVVATANDKAVEALGCGLRSPDTLLVSLGTYICGMTVGERNIQGSEHFWSNFASTPHAYLYESSGIRRGMWTVSWFRDLLGELPVELAGELPGRSRSAEDLLNEGAASVNPGSDGLMTVLDWLAPTEAPYRRGSMLGFDGRHGRFHIYRSILEGIAYTICDRAGEMGKELGVDYGRVIVSGGGSTSDLMMQIFADVFGLPAERTEVNNGAAVGAAICVAVGLGIYPSFDEATAAMVRTGNTFEPEPAAHDLYSRMLGVYREVPHFTDEVYKRYAAASAPES